MSTAYTMEGNMKDYIILTDVACDVMHHYVEEGKVHRIPMEMVVNGEPYNYYDNEEGMTSKLFYQYVREKAPMSTAKISPMRWEEYFEKFASQGLSLICICLSTGLTDSYYSAETVAADLMKKYPGVEVLPIDSVGATGVEGLICERALENKEKGMSVRENYDDLQQFKKKLWACAYVDNLDALQRGGRISKAVAFVGGLLGIKPLIQFAPDGSLSMWEKQRGYKASTNKLIEYYTKNGDLDPHNLVYITHADQENYANELAEKIKAVNPNCTIKIRMLSPIIGVHLGSGGMVLAFVGKENRCK